MTQPPVWLAFPNFQRGRVFSRDDETGSQLGRVGSGRILIVEDDYLVADQMAAALSDSGYAVTAVVASAEEAIEVASREPVALAIMDIRLSGQRDGVDAAIELSRIGGIRFIFATAHSDASVRKRAEEVKPLAWLQKPYSMASLVQTVRAALND
jgi:DNA-binding response OmpR family regulator